jgi:hypothetical protein
MSLKSPDYLNEEGISPLNIHKRVDAQRGYVGATVHAALSVGGLARAREDFSSGRMTYHFFAPHVRESRIIIVREYYNSFLTEGRAQQLLRRFCCSLAGRELARAPL